MPSAGGQQIAGEQIGTAAKETAGVLERSVARVGDTSQAAIRQIDTAFGQFHDHAAQLNATAGATADAMSQMLSTIESATEALRHLDSGRRTVADHTPHRPIPARTASRDRIGARRPQFRRGVVLAAHHAEALLLLIFLFKLILAIKLNGQSAKIVRLSRRRSGADQPGRDAARDREAVPEAEVRHHPGLCAGEAAARPRQCAPQGCGALGRPHRPGAGRVARHEAEEAAKALLNEAAIGRQALDAAKKIAPDLPPEQAVQALLDAALIGKVIGKGGDPDQLLASAASCHSDLQSCKNQTVYLNSKLNAKSGGFGLPPCWVDQGGKIQYIFDASLQDDGIEIDDNQVGGREADQAKLPLGRVKYRAPMSRGDFADAFEPLLAWSNQHGCRFYVRLYDDMKTADRSEYKVCAVQSKATSAYC